MEIITLIFAGVVALSTVVYAILTQRLVNETRIMRRSQTNPEVSVSLSHNEISISFIDLLVENIGMGPAYDIKFKVIKDFELLKGRKLTEVGFVKNGIRYMAPRQNLRLYLASFIENPKELEEKEIELIVSYKNGLEENFERKFVLSFSQYASFFQLGSPPLHKIANNLEKIRNDFHSIIDGFKRIKVNIYDSEDREIEEEEIEKRMQEHLGKKNDEEENK